jgi:hypothetical protein
MEKLKECVSICTHTMEKENSFYTRKHCEIKRITNVPDRATARRGGAQLVIHILKHPTSTILQWLRELPFAYNWERRRHGLMPAC